LYNTSGSVSIGESAVCTTIFNRDASGKPSISSEATINFCLPWISTGTLVFAPTESDAQGTGNTNHIASGRVSLGESAIIVCIYEHSTAGFLGIGGTASVIFTRKGLKIIDHLDPVGSSEKQKIQRQLAIILNSPIEMDPVGGNIKIIQPLKKPKESKVASLQKRLIAILNNSVEPDPVGGNVNIIQPLEKPKESKTASLRKQLERIKSGQ
jgi:hypothetical protein